MSHKTLSPLSLLLAAAIGAAIGSVGMNGAAQAQDARRGPLDSIGKVYGAIADPDNPGQLLLGSGLGLLRASPDGMVDVLDGPQVAVSTLAAAPDNARRLFLSGYSADGTPAGILFRGGDGTGWQTMPGTAGEGGVIVASMGLSRLDDNLMIGLNKTILLSEDGGANWSPTLKTPDKTFSVALSGTDRNRLFAATMDGLMISEDGGASWARSYDGDGPATAVASLGDGRVIGFIYGAGVIAADEAALDWRVVGTGFGPRYLRSFSQAPDGAIYGVADTGAILLSRDGGSTWISFEGSDKATPEIIASGQTLFAENCQACHGVAGIGEDPSNPEARDDFGFKAPALNDDMHAWHHSDAGLLATTHKGSSRNSRMIAWEEVLSEPEMDAILAYIKSTWSIPSLACQGTRHMACLQN